MKTTAALSPRHSGATPTQTSGGLKLAEVLAVLEGLKIDGVLMDRAVCFTEMQPGPGFRGTFVATLDGLSIESIAAARRAQRERFQETQT